MANILDLREQNLEVDNDTIADAPEKESKESSTPTAPQQIPRYIAWDAHEFDPQPKPHDWYLALGILTIGLLVVAVIMKNLLFGIFVTLAGFTLMLFGAKKPRVVHFSLSPEGIRIDNELHPLDTCKSFWILYNPPISKELILIPKSTLAPVLKIPLGEQNPLELRAFLVQFLAEKQFDDSLIDLLAKYLRF